VRRLLLLCACLVLVAGCGSSSSSSSDSKSKTSSTSSDSGGVKPVGSQKARARSHTSSAGCQAVAKPKARRAVVLPKPTVKLNPAKTYLVTVQTNCGPFVIRLDVKRAPKTSASFYSLAKSGFYNGLAFHRVAQGFVIQGGDPLGTGAGGPGYKVVEPPPKSLHYTRGMVAMAKAGNEPSGTSGSQFFVVTSPDATASAGLTPDYALVGQVVSGMPAVTRIGITPTTPPGDGEPDDARVMEKVTVASR
jgi:peptidyl-prolyl cis-trans isomerase B (cyclophilin B)